MTLQKIVATTLLVSMMLGAGFQANRAALVAAITESGLLLRAFLANFVIVPFIAVVLVGAFHLADSVATGLLLMAIAPGVPFVVLSGGRSRGGSHEFAITLALLMPALSTLTIPFTAELVLPATERPEIPPSFLISLLLYQIAPLLVGALVAQLFPAITQKIARPIGYITFAAFLLLLSLLLPAMVRGVTTTYGTFGLLAMLVTAVLSLVAGWALGGKKREYRRALAIGTALRNPGVAMMIATTRFPNTTVATAVAAYFLVQVVVASLAGNFFKRTI